MAEELFRRHVAERAHHDTFRGHRRRQPRLVGTNLHQSEIQQLNVELAVRAGAHHVLWFQIAMNQAGSVR